MGSILVISGPSGSGKTSLAREVCESFGEKAYFSISSTTRNIREGEKDGVDYNFLSREEFLSGIDKGEFLEWAEVHGNFYGTSLKNIKDALSKDKIVFLDIDVQGYEAIKKIFPEITTSIFVTTKDIEILKDRLNKRGTETEASLQIRTINALNEMKKIDEYEYLLINDKFEDAKEFLYAVAKASLIKRSKTKIEEFISNWKKVEK